MSITSHGLATASVATLAAVGLVVSGGASSATGTATAVAEPASGTVTVQDSREDMLGHGADIFSVKVVNRDRVRVVIAHRDLVRSWRPEASGTIYLDTDRSTAGPDFALVAGLYSGTGYTMYETDGWKIRYRRPVEGSYQMRLRFDTDRTVLNVERATVGDPRVVRASVHTAGNDGEGHTIHDWLKRPNSFTPWVAHD